VAIAAAPVALLLVAPSTPPAARERVVAEAAVEAVTPRRLVVPVPRVAPRPPAPPRRTVTVAPAPERPARRAPREVVSVGREGSRVTVVERAPRRDDGLVCVRDTGLLPVLCVFARNTR
jgi:hypothetical protein